ncbi:DMT family transporter [Leptolyngbya sp. FACHB-261]|uniref:DMT family transporter n=1 Tax=Leptolyngbya sp. FACHB-261 TaxID=2692806 RepID=UPI001686C39C|nr:DMT family transporter [Leptolyngbya sp. FACHB-261]MBD2099559.1 DMT family transporter [Leptolyngbya sp. FACHB-261]
MDILPVILAILGGVVVTLQSQFMSVMDQKLGTLESVFITYSGGGVVAALVMLGTNWGNLRAWQNVPWYAFSSGLLGLFIVATIGYIAPRLGLATGFTLMVASQFILAALIDQFGLLGAIPHPLETTKLLGLGILLIGVWLIVR